MSHTIPRTDFDDVLEALGSRSRRQLLVSVLEERSRSQPVRVDELASERERDSLVRAHHVDLPKLAEMDYVSWDRETDRISAGPQFDDVRPLLELLMRHEDELPYDWL